MPLVALVGYTNAGKTTLFNLLTNESAEASNALFVTLDPLVRQVSLPDKRQLLLSDTVGFIDRLPHTLVAAFRATLEQVAEADLILHVIDAASPDRERHVEAVRKVLEEVGAAAVRQVGRVQQERSARRRRAKQAAARASRRVVYFRAERQRTRKDVIDAVRRRWSSTRVACGWNSIPTARKIARRSRACTGMRAWSATKPTTAGWPSRPTCPGACWIA